MLLHRVLERRLPLRSELSLDEKNQCSIQGQFRSFIEFSPVEVFPTPGIPIRLMFFFEAWSSRRCFLSESSDTSCLKRASLLF